jgi:Flp pilus assembly protein TadB
MRIRPVNLAICVVFVTMGLFMVTIQERKARAIERETQRFMLDKLQHIFDVLGQLQAPHLTNEQRESLLSELRKIDAEQPKHASYQPYHERLKGWPLGSLLVIGGVAALFVHPRRGCHKPPST